MGAGLPDGKHLRVGGRIVGRSDAIHALSDDLTVSYDYRSERAASPRTDIVDGKLNGSCHEGVTHLLSSPIFFGFVQALDSSNIADTSAKTTLQVYAEFLALRQRFRVGASMEVS
jgi:hypothetical protein